VHDERAHNAHRFNAPPLEGNMKKLLLTCASMALLAGPAFAQETQADPSLVVTDATIKRILTRESILVTTLVTARATINSAPEKFAESMVTANQSNAGNTACGNCAEKDDLITGSGTNNSGIISMNQASGNNSNQGTIVSVAIDADDDEGPPDEDAPGHVGFAHASAAATQSQSRNNIDTVNLIYRDAVITNSLNSNTGLVYANQSSGNMNNQLNTLSLAFSLASSGVALSEAALGQFNTNGRVGESTSTNSTVGINKLSRIANSLNDNVGIFGVNQSSGNMANQANIVSVAAIGTNLPTF
jgi:hypothetical protein